MTNKQKGDYGEEVIANFLKKRNLEILCRNYRTKFCEIDIICKKENRLYFIEVKARTNLNFGYPSEAVDKRKQDKIRKGAMVFIKQYNMNNYDIAFYIAEVYIKNKKINFIKNAF